MTLQFDDTELPNRHRFSLCAFQKFEENPLFSINILVSDDEAHFCLNGYVNKQNCHIWYERQP